jgi:hypothetical protein
MIFKTQIRRKSSPLNLEHVFVYLDSIEATFSPALGSPLSMLKLRIRVHTVTGAATEPDDINSPWPHSDIEKIFYATEGQYTAIGNRLRDGGNLMQAIRAYCKNKVDVWNDSVVPGGQAATHTDIDNDSAS